MKRLVQFVCFLLVLHFAVTGDGQLPTASVVPIQATIVPIKIQEVIPVTYFQIVQIFIDKAKEAAALVNIDASLVMALIKQESNGESDAYSNGNAYGLMQITAPALAQYNQDNKTSYTLFDIYYGPNAIELNMKIGSWYIKWCLNAAKDLKEALRYYNAGIGVCHKDPNAGLSYANSVLKHQTNIETILAQYKR